MIYNYFLLALRNFTRQSKHAVVNMLGLAIGLAVAILIMLYVKDEMTFDTMHPKASKTYRLGYKVEFPNGSSDAGPYVPAGWDNYLKDNFTDVEESRAISDTEPLQVFMMNPTVRLFLPKTSSGLNQTLPT
ncbi:MAG: hypothetical protein WDN75_04515 [Bacteroidota bacterium]